VTSQDWAQWHEAYGEPDSSLAQRLMVVQERIRDAVSSAAPGPIRIVSMCAGDGRDLIGALLDHPRRADVRARLLELNSELVQRGRAAAWNGIEFVAGDAAVTDHYAGAVPADVVLACGVFGNISDADVARTVTAMQELCTTGGAVIWTRHRDDLDPVPRICAWFESAGFTREWLSGAQHRYGVGMHRYRMAPRPLTPGQRLFTFTR
jgi:hypothetical protein